MATQRRMIYAQLAENKSFASMSERAQLTYIFLIVLADDDGRLKGDTEWLRIKIFPYNTEITRTDIKRWVNAIWKKGLIKWYKAEDGNYYIQHPNWEKYQILRSDRKKESDLPPPDDNQVSTKRARNISKINKKREDKEKEATAYLLNIPEKDLNYFYNRFDCSKKAIISKGEVLLNYCKMHNKWYEDYQAFLLNSIKVDFPERVPVKKEDPNPEKDQKPVKIPEDIKADIKKIIGDKTKHAD